MEKSHWILQKATVSFPLRISITGGRDFKSATNDNEANKPNICITSMYLLPNIPSQNSAASLNFKAFSNELHPVRVEIKTSKKISTTCQKITYQASVIKLAYQILNPNPFCSNEGKCYWFLPKNRKKITLLNIIQK